MPDLLEHWLPNLDLPHRLHKKIKHHSIKRPQSKEINPLKRESTDCGSAKSSTILSRVTVRDVATLAPENVPKNGSHPPSMTHLARQA